MCRTRSHQYHHLFTKHKVLTNILVPLIVAVIILQLQSKCWQEFLFTFVFHFIHVVFIQRCPVHYSHWSSMFIVLRYVRRNRWNWLFLWSNLGNSKSDIDPSLLISCQQIFHCCSSKEKNIHECQVCQYHQWSSVTSIRSLFHQEMVPKAETIENNTTKLKYIDEISSEEKGLMTVLSTHVWIRTLLYRFSLRSSKWSVTKIFIWK